MSYSNQNFIATNSEFIALCQSQVAILTQSLGAAWTAVYLTEGLFDNSSKKLIPVVIYPADKFEKKDLEDIIIIPHNWQPEKIKPQKILGSSLELITPNNDQIFESLIQPHQIVLPLICEKVVMGLLITGRKDRDWNNQELSQIEKIAKTLAIARLLDQRQEWYQQQLTKQLQRQSIQRDRLDDLLHQLKNPLTALRTFSKLLLKRLFSEDRNYSVAEGMLRESDRIQELLQHFDLDIDLEETEITSPLLIGSNSLSLPPASPQSSLFLLPGNSFNLEAIFLEDILNPLIESFQAIATEKQLNFMSKISHNLAPVQGNSQALREVFSNLLDNAIKYTTEGGKIMIKSLNNSVENSYQGIAISDSGYGIPREDQNNLFQRHYRGVQEKGDIPGTGLGLAIVKKLLDKMGGKIEVISPNLDDEFINYHSPGTTFIVWLKIRKTV
jgi:signal transduction histidine kinase